MRRNMLVLGKIYHTIMKRMDWEHSGLKSTAVDQCCIIQLLTGRAAARLERWFRAEKFQKKSGTIKGDPTVYTRVTERTGTREWYVYASLVPLMYACVCSVWEREISACGKE